MINISKILKRGRKPDINLSWLSFKRNWMFIDSLDAFNIFNLTQIHNITLDRKRNTSGNYCLNINGKNFYSDDWPMMKATYDKIVKRISDRTYQF